MSKKILKRVKFIPSKQRAWLREVKENSGITWNEMASLCGVSRATIFNYLAEKYLMPLPVVEKLESFDVPLEKKWIVEMRDDGWHKSSPRRNNVTLPKIMNLKLAELVGALLGNGHIGSSSYEISIMCGLRLDAIYMKQNLVPFFEELFNISPNIYETKKYNGIRCKVYSKIIHSFLTNEIGLPAGKKINSNWLRIPQFYMLSKEHLIACIRGLFDTDGGICRHRERNPMIEFDSHNGFLSSDILEALIALGFKATMSQGKVYIYAKKDIERFFKVVGSHNPRNMVKYLIWKGRGIVPKTGDITRL